MEGVYAPREIPGYNAFTTFRKPLPAGFLFHWLRERRVPGEPDPPVQGGPAGFEHAEASVGQHPLETALGDLPHPAPRLDELDLVVRVTVRPGPSAGPTVEQKNRDAHVAPIGADELVGASGMRKVGLVESEHGAGVRRCFVRA